MVDDVEIERVRKMAEGEIPFVPSQIYERLLARNEDERERLPEEMQGLLVLYRQAARRGKEQ